MTIEQYNQLSYDYAHCAGTHCENSQPVLASYNLHDTRNKYERALYSLESVMHSFTVRNSYFCNEMF